VAVWGENPPAWMPEQANSVYALVSGDWPQLKRASGIGHS
jgi:hypothetical protein